MAARITRAKKKTAAAPDAAATIPHAPKAEDVPEMILPSDPKTVFVGGLFLLALLGAAYLAAEIVLPFVFAFILNLLLQPAMRRVSGWRVPRALAALLLILAVFGTIVAIGAGIAGPASTWAAKLPEGVPRLQEKLSFLREPIDTLQRFIKEVEGGPAASAPPAAALPSATTTTPAPATPAAAPAGPDGSSTLITSLFAGTRSFASGLLTTVLFLFFLLVSGDVFVQRLIEVMPRTRDKKLTLEISQQIEEDVSAYLITITIMNAAVGILTGLVMWLTGLGDPVLWGAVAFLLNYVPILGWLTALATFLLAGLLTFDTLGQALVPAGLYVVIHVAEGETITPMLLARRFTLNPVVVVLSLVFWFWMWGVPGAIIAVPMVAITKIICDRVRPLQAFGHFLEG